MNQELRNRWIWGLLGAAVCLTAMFWLGPEAVFLIASAAGLWGWREYCRMMDLESRPALRYLGFILLGAMFTHAFFVGPKTFFWIWITWLVGFTTLYVEYALEKRRTSVATFDVQRSWTQLCRFVLGVIYVFMLLGFAGPIVAKVNGEQTLTLCLVGVFVGDSAAYFVGRKYGRRKIWPELSPGKTIEGAYGGWAGSFLGSLLLWVVFHYTMRSPISLSECLVVGAISGPLSQAGDFMESLLKRVSGRKDSGALMPGHGGILDRADSLFFVLPVVYFLF